MSRPSFIVERPRRARALVVLVCAGVFATIGQTSSAAPPKAKTPKVYKACPSDKVWSDEQSGCVCGPGTTWDRDTKRCAPGCPPGMALDANGACAALPPDPKRCAPGMRWSDGHGRCVVACPQGKVADASGNGCVSEARVCPSGSQWSEAKARCVDAPKAKAACPSGTVLARDGSSCIEVDEPACPAGQTWSDEAGRCLEVAAAPPPCPKGSTRDTNGACVSDAKRCPAGKEWKDAFDGCVPACPPGQVLDFHGIACHSIKLERRRFIKRVD